MCLQTFNNIYKALDQMRSSSVFPDTETNEEMRQRVTKECKWSVQSVTSLLFWTRVVHWPNPHGLYSHSSHIVPNRHGQPRSETLESEAKQDKTKLFQSLGTIWPLCEKGKTLDNNDLNQLRHLMKHTQKRFFKSEIKTRNTKSVI